MKDNIKNVIAGSMLLLDGGMGTVLQKLEVQAGKYPELLNISSPETIEFIQRSYVSAGSQVIYTNTFGANRFKLEGSGSSVSEIVHEAIKIARKVSDGKAYVALDIGPLGRLLEPLGSLSFEDAYDAFKEIVTSGKDADLIVIETVADLYEAKAALLAAKESSDLPVFVTMSFEKNGRTYTGCRADSMARTLTALGADAIGLNCSVGPDSAADIIRTIANNTHLPVIAKPNAGLPDPVTGSFMTSPEQFAAEMEECVKAGATIIGGCCGTSPEYIALLHDLAEKSEFVKHDFRRTSVVCTPTDFVEISGVRTVGERINPTGKKRFQQALLENDLDYILGVAVAQADAGADILDVNVGFPGINEAELLPAVVKKIQSAVGIPLQLDSSDPDALEAGLRVYNGVPAVNSVNGDPVSRQKILPLVKKYGASVVGLALNGASMPKTAEERFQIAEVILNSALEEGIPKENVWIDCLALTASAQQEQAAESLRAIRMVKERLGLKVLMGVSNISFGMPERQILNRCFLAEAFAVGLDLAIIDPTKKETMDVVRAHRVFSGEDAGCAEYINAFSGAFASGSPNALPAASAARSAMDLETAIIRGLGNEAGVLAKKKLETESEISLVENFLIPALDKVGEGYEKGRLFLPQLLSSAQAAQSVFEVIKVSLLEKGGEQINKGTLAVATVKGDIHDIGKNIVKTVLENYGYTVIDLGKDVSPEDVCSVVREKNIRLVGLSALMTTTLKSMEETVRMLRTLDDPPAIVVGGAVVTPDYAEKIGADFYSKDAKESVEIARKIFG